MDPDARIFLFGSRVHDEQKGGDIDLLIFSRIMDFSHKIELKYQLFEKMEEQKIDIILSEDLSDPFVKHVYTESIEL